MTQEHPITPPPELVMQWLEDGAEDGELGISKHIATQAARWGADTELDACCWWADATGWQGAGNSLRLARRPKPPSLKEQALKEMDKLDAMWDVTSIEDKSLDIIRRALEQLPEGA